MNTTQTHDVCVWVGHTFVLHSDGSEICSRCKLYRGPAASLKERVALDAYRKAEETIIPVPWDLNGRKTPGTFELVLVAIGGGVLFVGGVAALVLKFLL